MKRSLWLLRRRHSALVSGCRPSLDVTFLQGRPCFKLLSISISLLFGGAHAFPQQPSPPTRDLTEVPVEKLMEIEVYSPAKRAEKLSESPAAISVLTQEDIHRSGATSIPEALRLAPGLDVAQVDGEQWAISARGFNDVFANKLLVLQDGRSVYTPLFSGVFWNVQDPFLPDVDRIEVIRGPGASLWGANAVNGVINIITKSARDTQGVLATAGGGTIERAFAGVRYGDTLGQDVFFRVYGKYFDRAPSDSPNGGEAADSWQRAQGGFRLDWDTLEKSGNLLTLQGDIYGSSGNQVFNTYTPLNPPFYSQTIHQDDYRTSGGNLLGRFTHQFSDRSDLALQVYYDRTVQDTVIVKEFRDTYDFDLQSHVGLGSWNDFVLGLGCRVSDAHTVDSPTISFTPNRVSTKLFSAFAQDEITLVPNRLRLTLGGKLEHNDYTGFELQPSGRLLWTPAPGQTLWGAISRAMRTPSEAEEDVQLTETPSPAVVTLYGNRDFQPEELLAYELGYRVEPLRNLSVDLTTFYNVYHDLRSQEFGFSPTLSPSAPPPPPFPPQFVPMHLENGLGGDTFGFELAPTWVVNSWWRLRPAYSLVKMQIHRSPGSTDPTSKSFLEGSSPQQQASLRSSMDLPCHLSLDSTLRYVDRLPALQVSGYIALDLRVGWRPCEDFELAVVGQNLLQSHHTEFIPTFIGTQRTELPQSVYVQLTWYFGKKH